MKLPWSDVSKAWLENVSLSRRLSLWAFESIAKYQNEINELEVAYKASALKTESGKEVSSHLKQLRRSIKQEIVAKENSIDDITLNSTNSYKLQVSVPSNLNYLMKVWAAAEGRDLSSVALQCLETGLREMKSKGSIPNAAIKKYDHACEKRIVLAELNRTWETHDKSTFNDKL